MTGDAPGTTRHSTICDYERRATLPPAQILTRPKWPASARISLMGVTDDRTRTQLALHLGRPVTELRRFAYFDGGLVRYCAMLPPSGMEIDFWFTCASTAAGAAGPELLDTVCRTPAGHRVPNWLLPPDLRPRPSRLITDRPSSSQT